MNRISILLIDDEESQIQSISSFLKRREFNVYTATDPVKAMEIVKENRIDLIFTDFRMPGMTGLEVLKNVKAISPGIDVVVITAFGSVEDAVEIMKSGAYDYLTKPINLEELVILIERVEEKRILIEENKELRERLNEVMTQDSIISTGKEMENILNTVARIASSKATVLIRGESGTGKEMITNAVHLASSRKDKRLVTVNVAALSETLLESELFGHEKGSFTGALQQRVGKFELADKGTIFIDEVGDIPLNVQVKLLRVIQFGQIERIGSNIVKEIDVRIIAATHRNLEEMISKGEFREDLYYRLNVVQIELPPLRKRKEDIPALIEHFIKKYNKINQKEVKGISNDAMDKLSKYDFPGNVRELENIIERAVVLCRDEYLTVRDLPFNTKHGIDKSILDPYNLEDGYEEKVQKFEIEIITEALKQTNGNQSAAARILKISERHLRSRLERLGMKK